MLTLPRIIDQKARPYVAIRRRLKMPFDADIGPAMGALFAAIAARNIRTTGPAFFKYNVIAMPELEIEFGMPVAEPVAADGDLVASVLPAGRYAETTFFGHYDHLMNVNAILIGWAKEINLTWDATTEADGDHFAARLEIYHNDPDEEPDPARWQTTLMIKVKD
jgi:effector-binding domain-containing protein